MTKYIIRFVTFLPFRGGQFDNSLLLESKWSTILAILRMAELKTKQKGLHVTY